MLALESALVAVFVMAGIILACRAVPFLLFSGRKPPAVLSFIERFMPPIAMTVLVVSSFASINWTRRPHGVGELAAGAAVVVLHLWRRNALISIFGGTGFYLLLRALIME
jgi:branched-subunit amino acid transport protein AzlD